MSYSLTQLTQSPYFTAAFNTAIFDGPFRIYFSQVQEAYALELYFKLQRFLGPRYEEFKKELRQQGQYVFFLIYPHSESFELCFQNAPRQAAREGTIEGHPTYALVAGEDQHMQEQILASLYQRVGPSISSATAPLAPA